MSNATDAGTVINTNLTLINILTYVFLCVVTFGIGSAVEPSALRLVVRERRCAFAVGLLSQYLVMPAAARFVEFFLAMPPVDAFGLVLIGCCPGGATSNAFAYFAKADMALSVSMTAVSNALAFATLPLLLSLWTRDLDPTLSAAIPFVEIMGSLLMVLIPAGIGVALRAYRRNWAKRAEKLGAISGAVLILSSATAGLIQNRDTLAEASLFPWKNGLAVCLVSPIGMVAVLLAAACLDLPFCRRAGCCFQTAQWERLPLPALSTIILETGIQNTVLSLAIATLTARDWSTDAAFRLQLISIMWGLIVSTEAIFVMLLLRALNQRWKPTDPPLPITSLDQEPPSVGAASSAASQQAAC